LWPAKESHKGKAVLVESYQPETARPLPNLYPLWLGPGFRAGRASLDSRVLPAPSFSNGFGTVSH
jgi:hypothetical protein